ncbi:MAG: exodeoxyribonuclease VII small subunit [Candidatus Cloacimonadia bacterium]
MSEKSQEKIKFEDALKRLQEIVEILEAGNIEIEKALDYYEEGINLVKICSERLKKIENKITILNEKQEEETTE